MKIVSSAGMGREWRASKTDEEYGAEIIRDSENDFEAVARETGQPVNELRATIAVRATTDGGFRDE
ncbi:hypothetical protein [Streptomyces sp. NPDC050560]|uniref:hypothetical protein n=1 Tax=Streptomyces sp. NPDC050560 TaxID=3365630 RepID=UPI0037B99793